MLRGTRRQLIALLSFFLAISWIPAALADAATDGARQFLRVAIDEAMSSLTDKNVPKAERVRRFTDFLYKYGDSPATQQGVLGRFWARATAEQQAEYLQLFERYIVGSYVDEFTTLTPGERIDLRNAELRADGRIIVHSVDVDPTDVDLPIEWILVQRPDGQYRVADAMISGVSIVQKLTDEFTGIIRSNGGQVAALLAGMQAKIASYGQTRP